MFASLLHQPKPVVWKWAEDNITLPRQTSPNDPGKFSTSRMPYIREPMEAMLDAELTDVSLCFGAQSGKTLAALVTAVYAIDNDPLPAMWVLPTEKLCKSFHKGRLGPVIDANPVVSQHKPVNDDNYTWEEKHFDLMPFYMSGATSPANLSSKPIARLYLDEEAKYAHEDKNEGHPSDLAGERTKTFPRRMSVHLSTPSTESNYFWAGFAKTDYRKFFIPCPHCSEHITLEWSRDTLVWDQSAKDQTGYWDLDKVAASARYVCPECGGEIYDHHKQGMMEKGEWRPTNANASAKIRGYHLNSLYSPYVTFGDFARKFLSCHQGQLFREEALHNFTNSWCALPFSPAKIRVGDDEIHRLRSTYYRGKLPEGVDYHALVICYDPGQNQTHWVASLIGPGGQSWVVDWGQLLSFRTDDKRSGIRDHYASYEIAGVRPYAGLVDSGDWTKEIYDECYEANTYLWPSKGATVPTGVWNRVGLKHYPGLELYTYSDYQAKSQLYGRRIKQLEHPRLHLPQDADGDLIKGLSGQSLLPGSSGRLEWKKVADDHYGDCVKLAQVLWWVIEVDFDGQPPEQS